jgi:hypothetical protein
MFAPVSQTSQELLKVRPPRIVCKPLLLLLLSTGYGMTEFVNDLPICYFQFPDVIV